MAGGGTRADWIETSFPGRIVSGICLVAGPLLAVSACLLAVGVYGASGATFVHGMGEHRLRGSIEFSLQFAAMATLLFAVVEVAERIARVRPGLGRTAGVLTIVGILGPIFFNGVYFGAFQLAGGPEEPAAARLVDLAQVIPSVLVNVAGPALVAGFILLGVGAAKARVLPVWRAWALGLTCLIPVGFISGFIVISALAFACTAVALVPLGIRTLRGDERDRL
ncbi:MAG TPA: hypothetical protein VFX12_13090 [Vicinamibacterales bacterium]|nr:hypothetical protein [Vicinamibacterales bacterium]